jgi:hypothetical protein
MQPRPGTTRRRIWIRLLQRLELEERQELRQWMVARLRTAPRRRWARRVQALERLPAPLALGLINSAVMLVILCMAPVQPVRPAFVPLAIGAALCASLMVYSLLQAGLRLARWAGIFPAA